MQAHRLTLRVLAFLAPLVFLHGAWAQEIAHPVLFPYFVTPDAADNWTAGVGNWSTSGDWTAGVPNSSSAVTIGNTSNGYVTQDLAAAGAASLSILSGNTLFISPGNTLSIGGAASVSGGGQLLVATSGTGAGVVSVGGSLTNAGYIQVGNGSLGGASKLTVTGGYTGTGGRLVVQGGSFVGSNALFSAGGAAPSILTGLYEAQGNVGSAAIAWGSGGVTQIGDGATNSGTVLVNGTNAFLEVGASNSNSALKTLTTIAGNGELELDGGASVTTTGPLAVKTAGQLYVGETGTGGGALNIGGSLTNAGYMQVGNSSLGGPSTVKVTGIYTGTGGRVIVQGGNSAGTDAILNISGAAPGILTGTYDVQSNVGSAAVKWGSGAITQIGDGGSNLGIVEITGSNAYLEVSATNSNNALKTLNTIAGNGELELDGGTSVATTGALAVNRNGQLFVGDFGTGGATLNVGGSLSNAGGMQIGNTGSSGPSTVKVTGTFTGTGGKVVLQGGNAAGSNALLNVTGAAPAILTGIYNVQGSMGSAAVKWSSGSITQLGDGAGNQGIVSLTGTNAYMEIGATNTNSALKNLNTIAGNGELELDGGTSVTTTGPLAMNTNGQLFVGDFGPGGATMNIGGSLTNAGSLQIGNTGLGSAATVKVSGIYNSAGGRTTIVGGNIAGANALLNITGAAPATLTGTYNVQGNLGSAAVKWASGRITQIGDGAGNQGTVLITGTDAYLEVGATNSNSALKGLTTIAGNGQLQLSGGASVTTSGGSFTNAGLLTISTGSTFKVGGSSFNFTQTAGTTTVDGTLASAGAGNLSLNGGSLFGNGTVNYAVVDTGIVSPGESVAQTGKLGITGTYKQNAGGALDVTIGGTTAGTKYDQLNVTGTATLGGTLNISLASGFTPAIGSTFDILNASSIAGSFSAINGVAINGSEHFTVTTVGGNEIVLTVVAGAATPRRGGPIHQIAAPLVTRIPTSTLHPRAEFALPAAQSGYTAPVAVAGAAAPVSGPFASANKFRFECGVDLNALRKTGPRRLLKSLWAAPDSVNAVDVGYVMLTRSHS